MYECPVWGENIVLLGGPKEGWEVECGIEEADWDQIVLSLIVCAEDFCCYTKNNGKPLGVFIGGMIRFVYGERTVL